MLTLVGWIVGDMVATDYTCGSFSKDGSSYGRWWSTHLAENYLVTNVDLIDSFLGSRWVVIVEGWLPIIEGSHHLASSSHKCLLAS